MAVVQDPELVSRRLRWIVVVVLLGAISAGCTGGDTTGTDRSAGLGRDRALTKAALLPPDEYGLVGGGRWTTSAAGDRAAVRAALLHQGVDRQQVDADLEELFEVQAGDAHCTSVRGRPVDVAGAGVKPAKGGGFADQVVYRFPSEESARQAFRVLTTTCRYPVKHYRRCRSGDDCAWGGDEDGLDSVMLRAGAVVTLLERVDVDWKVPIQQLAPRLLARVR